ncbi:MAG: 2OG-Fe(II) oxygenase [Thalassobaculaceae bacterium]
MSQPTASPPDPPPGPPPSGPPPSGPPLFWGQRLPNFADRTSDGGYFELYRDVTRGPVVILANPTADTVTAAVSAASSAAEDANVIVLGDVSMPADAPRPTAILPDPDATLRRALFAGRVDTTAAIVAGADQRGLDAFAVGDDLPMRLCAALEPLRRPEGSLRRATAPVMVLPNLIDPALRQALLAAFHAENEEGTVSVTVKGERADTVVPDIKRRRDLTLDREGPLYAAVRTAIANRLMPELYKAWWVSHLRTESFYVASYTAERGDFFVAHRDNTLPHTAGRRIAVSVELNDDYAGGGLVFPEYSDDRWRAPLGGGLAFSCSLMHEAVAVTTGTRYVLLIFLTAADG